MKVNYSSEMYT